ncbi:Hypothetical protein NTJ_15771 [Nesidiocoris tenuis]|uniref:Uncharacterized protein n=1 Tax=Nesidiocoris tenuis TaxID=355587 RepID=A0ABN7BI92_9HEMI|nr:Hypothetical protein NTJ_15771 [Nesidiocoris tenuis]
MALKLDDLIGKKKEVAQVLDLSKATANNAEEFKKLIEKVPEFKIKPEKLKPEDVKIHDFSRGGRRKKKVKVPTVYQFADPLPEEMRSIRLEDLCPVNIQWNMLTTLRPKSKADTEYFSRLVELGKLEISTQEKEKKYPDSSFMKKMKNRAGIQESRYISCTECGEDFCQKEFCMMFQYENFRREPMVETIGKKETEPKRGRSMSKSKKRVKTRSKSKRKSSDRAAKPRSKSNSKPKGSGGEGAQKSPKSKSRSRSRSKSKGPGTSEKNGEEKVVKKVKSKGSPLNKKKVRISSKK